MIRTTDELKAQAALLGITRWPVRDCSICGYPCGYSIHGDDVMYDSGCDCVTYANFQPRSWDDLAETYNRNQPENSPDISQGYLDKTDATWHFSDVALKGVK